MALYPIHILLPHTKSSDRSSNSEHTSTSHHTHHTALPCHDPSTGRLVEEMRSGVDMQTDPKELTTQQVVRLHQLLHEAKFSDPSGSHLSPAGEYNLRLGVIKELHPDLIATYQGRVTTSEAVLE